MRKALRGMFIVTDATGTVVIPAHDGWNRATNENKGRGSFEVRALFGGGTTSVNLGIQTATDIRNPDGTPTALCTARTSNGVQDPDATAAAVDVNAKQAYRYVWILSSTSGVGGCWVGGYGETWNE